MVSVFIRISSRSGDSPCPHADAGNKIKVSHAHENLFYICPLTVLYNKMVYHIEMVFVMFVRSSYLDCRYFGGWIFS